MRYVNENLEGIISSIIDKDTVGVTVNNDFEIPTPASQVVKISFDEFLRLESQAPAVETKTKEKGFDENIYASFVQLDDQKMELYFINHTRHQLFLNYYSNQGKQIISKFFQIINPFDYRSIDKLELSNFNEWNDFHFQVLQKPIDNALPPILKHLQIPASKFFKHLRATPLLQKQGYLFLINDALTEEDINKLNSFGAGTELPQATAPMVRAPLEIIDLHIDKIHNNYTQLTKQESFQLQINYFQKNMEDALAAGMKKITFIHGVGNLKLKNEIVKYLKLNEHVRNVQDAPTTVFGFGATEVSFKES